jgi:hypothetical protein
MIKVGQIYRKKGFYGDFCFCVSNIWRNGNPSLIRNDGELFPNRYDGIDGCELIAEYPTWQEAVNSKEFKVGGK